MIASNTMTSSADNYIKPPVIIFSPVYTPATSDSTAGSIDSDYLHDTSSYTLCSNMLSDFYYEDELVTVKHVPFFFHYLRKRQDVPIPSVSFLAVPASRLYNRKVLRCDRKGIGLRIRQNN